MWKDEREEVDVPFDEVIEGEEHGLRKYSVARRTRLMRAFGGKFLLTSALSGGAARLNSCAVLPPWAAAA